MTDDDREKKRKARRDYYHFYKEHGICPGCRKRKPMPGKTFCEACLEKDSERRHGKKMTAEQRAKRNARCRKHRKELKAVGLCPICGKRKSIEGHTLCLECRLKGKRRQVEWRRKNGVNPRDGIGCYFCGEPKLPGKKVCAKHYKWLIKQAEHMREVGGHEEISKSVDKFWKLFIARSE